MKAQFYYLFRLFFFVFLVVNFSCKSSSDSDQGQSDEDQNNTYTLNESPSFIKSDTANHRRENRENSDTTSTSETRHMKVIEVFTLPLDSETPIFNSFSQPVMINDSSKLLWFNLENYSLDVFDLAKQHLEKKIYYEKSGPNALRGISYGSGINFVNVDTIVFYSRGLKRMYLSSFSGKVYKYVDLSDFTDGLGSVSLSSPLAYRKGSVFMQVLPNIPIDADETFSPNYNRIAKIDLKSGKIKEYEIPYPTVYTGRNISSQLKMIDIIYNRKIDKFIISFPLGGSIYVTDLETGVESYPSKSGLISKVIETDPHSGEVASASISNYYYWINSSYERIIYDPIHEVYLREARKGISENNFKERKFSSDREFVVLNANFEKIGTIDYESSGLYYHFFADDKIYWNKDLQKFNLENGVEDTIFFQSRKLVLDK